MFFIIFSLLLSYLEIKKEIERWVWKLTNKRDLKTLKAE